MPKVRSALLKRDDFEELRYVLVVKNTTTSTEVKASVPLTITDFRERGMGMRLPLGSCTLGHMLLLQITPRSSASRKAAPVVTLQKGPRKPSEVNREREALAARKEAERRELQAVTIEITAKVALVQRTDDESMLVEVVFYQHDEKKWEQFIRTLNERQDQIHKLVRAVKE